MKGCSGSIYIYDALAIMMMNLGIQIKIKHL